MWISYLLDQYFVHSIWRQTKHKYTCWYNEYSIVVTQTTAYKTTKLN